MRKASVVAGVLITILGCGDSGDGGGGSGAGGGSDDGGGDAGGGGESAGGAPDGGAPEGGGGGASTPSCEGVCPDVVAAACEAGPPTVEACVTGCEMIQAGPCATLYSALYDCAGDAPTYACDDMDRVTVEGCETENDALYDCLAG